MSAKAKAINTLYKAKRITIDGVRQAVVAELITAADYEVIAGEVYVAEVDCGEATPEATE